MTRTSLLFTIVLATSLVAHASDDKKPTPAPAPAATTTAAAKPVEPALKVAAASDLTFAFKDLGAAYEKKTGQKVEFSFGSTGLLAKQLAEGAPFDVFAAANVSFIDDVVKSGACDGSTKAEYAIGRLAMWSLSDPKVAPPASLNDLTDKRFVKIAIANPEHAPYGKAAVEAMTAAGVYDAVKPKLVYGENVSQTLQFAQSGNAEVALVSLAQTIVTTGGTQVLIDGKMHKEIRQALAVCGKPGPRVDAAKAFASFVNGADGRAVMRKFGFLLPGETLAAK